MNRKRLLHPRVIVTTLALLILATASSAQAEEEDAAKSASAVSESATPEPPPINEIDPLPEPALVGPDSEGEALSTDTPYDEEREPQGVEEIIITASKRAENIQDVPLSVTALGGQTLRDAGVTTFAELQEFVPNLEIIPVTDTRSTSIRIRGIGSVGSNAGVDPSVGVFIDGVYQGRAGMSVGDLLDIERVEVLRGPQGTLYGKNTAAGALNIITRRPDYEPSAYLEGVAGLYYDFQGRGYINQPLIDDTLALRVAGYYSRRDGWDVNRYNNQDVNNVNKWGLRAKLLWDVTEDLSILLNGDYSSEDSRSFVPEIIDYKPWPGFGPSTSLMDLPFNYLSGSQGKELPEADPYDFRVGANVEPKNRLDVGGLSIDTLYAFGDYDVRWLNAWRTYSTDSQFDADFSEFDAIKAFQNVDLNQFSSEFTVASPLIDLPLDLSLDFQSGLYFFYMNMDTNDRNGWEDGLVTAAQYACNWPETADPQAPPNPPGAPTNPIPSPTCNPDLPPPPPIGIDTHFPSGIFKQAQNNVNKNTHTTKTFAAYSQFQLHIRERLQIVAGFRISWEKKNREGTSLTDPPPGNNPLTGEPLDAPPLLGPPVTRVEELSITRPQGRVALQYEPTENTMVYASFANGFKSGGFNQLRVSLDESSEFGDESSLTYELGARTDWLDRQIVFNMTGYFTDYDDFQAQSFTGSTINIRNAGQLYSYGFEADLIYEPEQVENLRIGGSVGLNIATYQSFKDAAATVEQQVQQSESAVQPIPFPAAVYCGSFADCSQDLDGRPLDNAPEWSLNLFGAYEHIVPATSVYAFGRADYSYTSGLYLDQDLDENLFQPSYHLLNLRAGLRDESDFIEWTLWVTNVTDSEYLVTGFDVPVISGYAGVRGPPRQYGTTIRLHF